MVQFSRRSFVMITLCLSLPLCACSIPAPSIEPNPTVQALMQNPLVKPDQIAGVEPLPGSRQSSVNKVCATLSYSNLWESGDTEDRIVNTFLSRLKLTVDERSILPDSQSFLYSGPNMIVQDNSGKILGDIGTFYVCFPIVVAKGIHLATLQLTTTSGIVHSYAWAFQVE
jgi:hypothetical protein